MLERASTCLETGGRHLLRTPKRSLQSRRQLHSSFWHHGASDLNLPIWWAAVSAFGRAVGDVDDCKVAHHNGRTTSHGGMLLDFLYPTKTLALINRISHHSSDTLRPRRKRYLPKAGIRHFSTTPWAARAPAIEALDTNNRDLEEEMRERLSGMSASDALHEILIAQEPGKQELAWRLFFAIQERSRTTDLQKDFLRYISHSGTALDANRILEIFNAMPREARGGSAYRIAISAYLSLELDGSAVRLQEEAAERAISINIGTDIILRRIVERNKWELSLRVCKAFLRCSSQRAFSIKHWLSDDAQARGDSKLAWGAVSQLPYLSGHLDSFLQYIEQYQHEWTTTPENRQALEFMICGLAPGVMNQVLDIHSTDEDFIWDFFLGFFRRLQKLEVSSAALYEFTIKRILSIPRYRAYTNRRKIHWALYEQYRANCASNSTPSARPSWELLRRLIIQAGEHGSYDARNAGVCDLLDDARLFHPNDRIPRRLLRYLIIFHADRGEAKKVHEYFDQMHAHSSVPVTLKTLSSLVYVYARRVDVHGAEKQFERITQEFGLTPDIACWNVLLLAYVRADDLDRALHCFNRIMDAGLSPDTKTFGPLLDLCAARGDIEAFEAIFSKAEQSNTPIRADTRARAGYVQACLASGDPEGAEAIAHAMLKEKRNGSLQGELTHTWNLLINHYALLGDVASSRRLYGQMMRERIPLDTWTYASLMRGLIEVRQTNAAYKLLRVTMPSNNVRVHAFHYALVIAGFVREQQYGHALRAHNRMVARNIAQTPDSRTASLQAIGLSELRRLAESGEEDPKARLVEVEKSLREILLQDPNSGVATREPRHRRFIDSREHSVPDGYYGMLILLYSTRGAYEICQELFEAASTSEAGEADYKAPITLLIAIMEAHLRAKEYGEVAKCFTMAREQADKLVKTMEQLTNPTRPTVQFDSLIDPTVREATKSAKISSNRQQVLSRAARIYIRSLIAQNTNSAIQQAQRTMRSLLVNGYVLDNLTWNEYIQSLALQGRSTDAFATCEAYLMNSFPGWRRLNPSYIRNNIKGYDWMDLRRVDVKKGSILPRYKTLVVLAASYARARRDEQNGQGYDPGLGGWPGQMVEKLAPKTVRAIETMPRTGDPLQKRYLASLD